jgi:hypothetical protein
MRGLIFRLFALTFLFVHAAHTLAADNKTLNILLVIDTNAGKRGGDVNLHRACAEANEKRWRELINSVYGNSPDLKNRLTLDVIKDDKVSPDNIRKFYKGLGVNKERALLFIYSGHGALDEQKGHFLATSGGDLLRADLIKHMQGTGSPAVFLLTDCCSSICPTPAEQSTDDSTSDSQPAQRTPNTKAFYNLFYQTQGQVDITAAQAGTVAFLGFFTGSLIETLFQPSSSIRRDGADGPVSWEDYYDRVADMTSKTFQACKSGAGPNDEIKKHENQRPDMTFTPAVPPSPTEIPESPEETPNKREIIIDD